MTTLRLDRATILRSRTGADGATVFDAVVARAGVLHYPELGRRELYVPQNDSGLATLADAPVVVGHPSGGKLEPIARETAPGRVVAPRVDGEDLRAEIHLRDRATIAAIQHRELVELSVGYEVLVDETPGSWRGERYDAVQRSRRVDHVALLEPGRGRCGALCSIRSDHQCERSQPMGLDGYRHDATSKTCNGGASCTCADTDDARMMRAVAHHPTESGYYDPTAMPREGQSVVELMDAMLLQGSDR